MTLKSSTPPSNTMPLNGNFPTVGQESWIELVHKVLKGTDFEKKMTSRTWDDLFVKPLYTKFDTLPHTNNALPGHQPFTRGAKSTRGTTDWDIRQHYSGDDPQVLNSAILEDLAGGVTSLSLSMGSPHNIRIGRGDLAKVLQGVLLEICPVAFNAGENTLAAAREMLDLWKNQSIPDNKRLAHFDADPLSQLATHGYLNTPLNKALEDALSLVEQTKNMPGVTVLSADGHTYHCAGATEAQELACVLSTVVSFLRAADKTGLAVTPIFQKLTLTLAIDTDQFLSIAKLRAARLLLWRLAESMSAAPEAANVKITGISSWRMLAKRDPWTNIIRTTLACASGAMGGADSIIVLPFTYALGDPDLFARRIARNIQIVCQEESHLGRVLDPCGGSWYVENLTEELAKKAWVLFQEIEQKGGMETALQTGFIQDTLSKSSALRKKALRIGRSELTGVSAFPLLDPEKVSVLPRRSQDPTKVRSHISVPQLKMERLSEPFEVLRDQADLYAEKYKKPLQIFLASLGEVVEHNTRTTWVKNFLAAGGIHSEITEGYKDELAAAKAFQKSGLPIACLCSSDSVYAAQGESAAKALKSCGAQYILLAGRPGEREHSLRAAGVDQFIYSGLDAIDVLQGLQEKLQDTAPQEV